MKKTAFIKKLPSGKYRVCSRKGKNLGTFDSKSEAVERLRQVEYFKYKNASKQIDLDVDEFSYSSVLRVLRQELDKDNFIKFLECYKEYFDETNSEKVSMCKSLLELSESFLLEFDPDKFKQYMLEEDK